MFTVTHFIWLGIVVLIIVGMFLLTKYAKLSFDTILTILMIVCIVSELVKIFNNMEVGYKNGMFLDPGSLPFHLCTIQIFFVVALKCFVKNEKTKKKILGFMFPTMLIGGLLALLVPTCGTAFDEVQPYQYFIFHSFIVFFGLYIITNKLIIIDTKAYIRNTCYLAVLGLIVLWINSFLSVYNTNFMYLSRPPMDNLPLLNLDNGWYIYFITLVGLALLLMLLMHLPFIIIGSIRKNKVVKK